ncbi:MAG TPA: 16S rRNA (cytidine(1402)-2'-O)-methyltransferase [Candidatus Limnocylindrales bacterium]
MADAGQGSPAAGTLYVVATPIGNLGDMTVRAVDVLRSVPLVAAEDTRLTRRLWARYEIKTRLISYHAQSGPARERELLEHLGAGRDLAIVTDAGTPLVSDPGAELVSAWVARGGRVVPIPGASAVLAALVASGLPAARWTFEGFLPRRGRERRELIERMCGDERTSVLFEAPGRAAATLAELAVRCGGERRAALCRELTKLHEEIWRGSLAELAARAADNDPRGEIVIVVGGRERGSEEPKIGLAEGRSEVQELVDKGWSRSSAARDVAQRTGLARRELFREA